MRFAERQASDELGDLTDERLECLDIGVQCGIAATLDLLGIRLRRVPLGDGSTSIARGFAVDGPGAWPREPLPDEPLGE